ncbi:MAG: GNAT family N-acetyltransferase [Defluviitaleaceae bacterium]|nr:GNAT family N-acetyltransferase [Defluviitaleaceae bacterium]
MSIIEDSLRERLGGYEIIPVTRENFGRAMEIYGSNREFCLLSEGKEAEFDDCVKDVDAVPPGFDINDRLFAGLWRGGEIVAVLDLLRGYPEKSIVWIGLLMVRGGLHGMGIGGEIAEAVAGAAKAAGYEAIQLGVMENNAPGLGFWRKHGFGKIRESEMERNGAEPRKIIVLERRTA